MNFLFRKIAKLAGLQRSQLQRADPDPSQLLDQPAEMFEHQADLVVPAFVQADFVPGIVAFTNELQPGRQGTPLTLTT